MTRPTVIAASDLTLRSGHVAGRAALIARTLGAQVILAHVQSGGRGEGPPPDESATDGDEDIPRAGDDADPASRASPGRRSLPDTISSLGRKLGLLPVDSVLDPAAALAAEAGRLSQPGAPPVSVRVLTGPAGPALAGLALETQAQLLVLGLHRERRVLDLLRLTTMERVVLDSPVPVLIAHRPPLSGYGQVLALTDFSPASAAALAMAGRLAPEARFHAIHALQLPLGARFAAGDPAADEAITRAELLRAAFLAMPGLPALAEPPEIVAGGVHEVLAYRQNELAADLVCIGSHSGRDPGQLGNYARDLMRAPPTDLLVAKPG